MAKKKVISSVLGVALMLGLLLPANVVAASAGTGVWHEDTSLSLSEVPESEVPSLSSEESEAEAEGEEEPSYVPQMAAMAAAAAVDTKSYGQTDYGVSVYGNGTRGFIARAYAVIHGRTAGSSEIDYWANLLDKGNLSALGFIKSVLESPEFTKRNLSNEEYITVMCQVMQNKDPNENDMAYHKKHITKGYSRLRLTEFIEDSYEFIWLCEAYGMKQQAATNNGNNNSSSGGSTLPGAGSYGQSDYGVSVYGSGTRGFVARVYAVVHGRAAGSSEIDYWANLLNNGSTNGLGFIKSVFQSPEVTNRNLSNEDFITVMCRVMQNKDPNANDMAYHKGHISKGYSRNRLMESIEDSYEFGWLLEAYGMKQKATTNNGNNNSSSGGSTLPGAGSYGQSDYGVSVYGSGTRGFVARVYAVVHGRAAGSSEIDYWANLLNNGSTNGLGFIKSVFQSPEVTNRNLSNEDFITVMCRVMQNKDPNANDMAYHKGHISKGYSRNRLMESIEDSYEFGWLLQAYGLKQQPSSENPNTSGTVWNDENLSVKVNGVVVTDTAENILVKTVYAEVGGFKNRAVYQAQAVAAYTYIKYHNNRGTAPTLPLSAPPSSVSNTIIEAVRSVKGQAILYNGSLAQTTYYASSAGTTNSAKDMWGSNISYLVSVNSKYDVNSTNYRATKTVTAQQFRDIMAKTYGNLPYTLGSDPSTWIRTTKNSAGYVTSVNVGGRTPTTEYFYQTMIGLRSSAFDVSYNASNQTFTFTTYGYGHGVGMSQWGAYYYAVNEGWSYERILAHYYPGTTLRK